MRYNNLPGVQVKTNDGGLVSRRIPTTRSVVVLGTSGRGRADDAVPVVDPADSAQEYGLDGTLVRAMEETRAYSDNIYLFRIGTKAATLTGIGAVSGGEAGISLELGQREATAGTRYKIWYNAGALYLWLDSNLVYAADTGAGIAVDTQDTIVSGTATAGLALGTTVGPTAKTVDGAITLQAAAALADSGNDLAPDFTAAVTGLNMTKRQLYIAIERATELLENFPIQGIYCPDAIADEKNVAYYVSTDSTTADNNPATNTDALDWLKTTRDEFGNKKFHWASESVDSEGAVATPQVFASAADRLGKDYHEVHFAYQLARYASLQSEVLGGCVAAIGFTGPAQGKFDLGNVRRWIGFLPKYDSSKRPTAPGKGLLGVPHVVGTTAAKMNPLCHDYATGYRTKGLYQTVSGEYDGGAMFDKNQNPIDIGAYLHYVGDHALISNGAGQYVGSVVGFVAGRISSIDSRSSLLNKELRGVQQLYRTSLAQLDSLTFANINMLKMEEPGLPPVLLHGMTAAGDNSDYGLLSRVLTKFIFMKQIYDEAKKFIGESSADGMQLHAMKTGLDKRCSNLLKDKYIQRYDFEISTTAADQRLGRAFIEASFFPPDELVQLDVTIGISKQ